MTTRRRLIGILPLSLLAACSDRAATPPAVEAATVSRSPSPIAGNVATSAFVVEERDPQAVALGYVAVATRADRARFPSYAEGQACRACARYRGRPGDATGPCPLFAGRNVSADGWCSSFTKKA